ncbi:MAG: FkbM family methyltransferase [Deltaproteobacteria bacterium]
METPNKLCLNNIIECLPEIHSLHAHNSKIYKFLEQYTLSILSHFDKRTQNKNPISLGFLGDVIFPHHKMGAVDSIDLFRLDELIIFSFYLVNQNRYQRVIDIGANLGLHSIVMGRCGWQVKAYEPDPIHAQLLRKNLALNKIETVSVFEAAVSDKSGKVEFCRVLGNTTSSHIRGDKPNPYGKLECFPIQVVAIEEIIPSIDFVKIDAEGAESAIITSLSANHFNNTDVIVEIGSPENAEAIYKHLTSICVSSFAQKIGWQRVTSFSEMPINYKEGSLFLSKKPVMPWA